MKLFAKHALLAQGWARDVVIEVNAEGMIDSVQSNSSADGAQVLDGVLLSGMTNLHSHAFQRAMAGLTEYRQHEQDSFWSWRELMYRFAANITPEQLQHIAHWLYIEMLKAGFTGVCEFHYLHHDRDGNTFTDPAEMSQRIVNAANASGIALTHLPVLYRYAGFGQQAPKPGQKRFIHDMESYQRLLESLQKTVHNSRHQLGIAPHSLRAVDEDSLRTALAMIDALDNNAPVHIHIAEQQQEVQDCLQFSGERPVQWLQRRFDVNRRWCLVHATHINEEERQALARSGAVAGICTTTEANLGDGFFPIANYCQEGGAFGVGSDSNVSVSLVEELRWLEYGARLQAQRRAVLSNTEESVGQYLYSRAVRGGALASGRKTGAIAVGHSADFVVLQESELCDSPLPHARHLDHWLFVGHSARVRDVFVAGKHVVADGRHADEETAWQRYQSTLKALLQT